MEEVASDSDVGDNSCEFIKALMWTSYRMIKWMWYCHVMYLVLMSRYFYQSQLKLKVYRLRMPSRTLQICREFQFHFHHHIFSPFEAKISIPINVVFSLKGYADKFDWFTEIFLFHTVRFSHNWSDFINSIWQEFWWSYSLLVQAGFRYRICQVNC